MNDQRIIEEMARLDGWVWRDAEECFIRGDVFAFNDGSHHRNQIPRYLESHDAVQRVIDTLNEDQLHSFACFLSEIVGGNPDYWVFINNSKLLKATPRQKCEAILRAVGKWED